MGELLTTIRVGGISHPIKPIPRTLESDGIGYSIRQVCERPGGLILGEGDTGKSTYVRMLAEECGKRGPTKLFLLRRRETDFTAPSLAPGEVATIIFDGLDEFPESVRDILDFAESHDPDRYHIWVTSRSGDAAAWLCENQRFERIYHLADFTEEDVIRIAEESGIDGYEFVEQADEASFDVLLSKPGGAVLLMQMFANGRMEGRTPSAIMDEIAFALVSETRDGHVMSASGGRAECERLADAAGWLALCLEVANREAIWTGALQECPVEDLALDDIPLGPYDRRTFDTVLARRIFEPLTGQRLRVAYSDMPRFLAGRWLARSISPDSFGNFYKRVLARARDLSEFIPTAAAFEPRYGLLASKRYMVELLPCREFIEWFGYERFFSAFCEQGLDFVVVGESPLKDKYVRSLRGYFGFATYLQGVLADHEASDDTIRAAAVLLCGCAVDRAKTADALVTAMLAHRKSMGTTAYLAALLADIAGPEDRLPVLSRLRPLWESVRVDNRAVATGLRHFLRKFFDYPGWLISRRRHLPAEDDHLQKAGSQRLLTEREVVQALEGNPTHETVRSLLHMQELRGLRYGSLARFLDGLFDGPTDDFFSDRQMLLIALKHDPERYYRRIVEHGMKDPDEFVKFIDWADIKYKEVMRGNAYCLDSDAAEEFHGFLVAYRGEFKYLHADLEQYLLMEIDPEYAAANAEDGELYDPPDFELLCELAALAVKPAEPVRAVVVDVAKPVAEKLQTAITETVTTAVKNKGGRPKKTDRAAGYMSQGQVAAMFGKPCTGNTVSNWESYMRSGGKRGARPPEAEFEGHLVVYTSDLREFPTEKNMLKLAALIERYKSTRAVKDNISHKRDTHFKSDETQFRKQVGVQGYRSNERNQAD